MAIVPGRARKKVPSEAVLESGACQMMKCGMIEGIIDGR